MGESMSRGGGGRSRVVVAMSGGVDSSVAAALLKEDGHEVIGIAMQLWDYTEGDRGRPGSCCSTDDIYDARRVADRLGIPFYVVNMERAFYDEVVRYFIESYTDGRTPNPCLKCNQVVKFELLMRKAMELEAAYLATGHYARVEYDPVEERYRLLRGLDRNKDQSYFLFTMTQAQLSRTLFPLGGLTKGDVRQHARRLGLYVAWKEESQEICFVTNGSYPEFIADRVNAVPGEITDRDGNVLGGHNGIFNYTVGQRKGLGIGGGDPLYVLDIDRAGNRIIVGPEEGLFSVGLTAEEVNWVSGEPCGAELIVRSKVRYRHDGVESILMPVGGDGAVVRFRRPERAITPGQAVVFYRGDEVVGGGWIEGRIEGPVRRHAGRL